MTDISLGPQEGPQEEFLKNDSDIAFYGGAAGGGKTYALLLDFLRHFNNKEAGAVCFRRTSNQVRNEGGLWDTSKKIYSLLGAEPKESSLTWVFPAGCKLKFSHLEYNKNVMDWQGAQIPIIYFDELTHFTEKQFWYMLSRNRSVSGVKPYIRATTNPSAKSWVKKLVEWYIGDDGLPIKERAGVKRYFIRDDNKLVWSTDKKELEENYPGGIPKSFTFIPSKLSDNRILCKTDPSYLANLKALSKVERLQLLDGNWNIEESAGIYFKKSYFEEVNATPPLTNIVRCWDRAASEFKDGDKGDPDFTVGLKLGVDKNNQFYILDIIRERYSALKVEQLILNTAKQDGVSCIVKGFQDPGGAGKNEIENFIRMLSGFQIEVEKINVDKQTASKPSSAQAEAGNIKILKSCRNKENFYIEAENFPEGRHDDIIDAFTGAFNYLSLKRVDDFTNDFIPNNIVNVNLNEW
jgi:predicted phage terminase large subunit-like protein